MMKAVTSLERDHTGGAALPAWNYVSSGTRLLAREEQELARRAQAGDQEAHQRMLDANVPLVFSIAHRYRSRRLEVEDLVQEGMIGLCTAIQRFDAGRRLRFSTYATYWIRQRILRALDRQTRLVHVPVDVHYAGRKAEAIREELLAELGREPTIGEVAEQCGISEDRLQAALLCDEEPLSLDAPVAGGMEDLSLDVADPGAPDPEERVLQEETWGELRSALGELSSRDRLVLESRFGLNGDEVSLAELSERLHVSPEGVRQIQRRALRRLQRRWQERTAPASSSG